MIFNRHLEKFSPYSRIEVVEFPNGMSNPNRSVKMDEIGKGIIHNRRYRNRRIGNFLKELDMTEGRGTGIPIIRKEMRL